MFWGLIIEPNKRYTQVVEKPFHISQAALDTSTGDNDACQVMVVVDGKNFLVCTLQKNKSIQVPLDLYFKSGNSIAFLTNGNCNVHLTGYLDPDFDEEEASDEEEDSEEEVPSLVPIKNKRKIEAPSDATANKKAKQDKKAAKKPAADSSDDEDEDDNQLEKLLDGEDLETDDNDESFKVNASLEATDEDEEDSDDEEEDDDEEEEVEENEAEESSDEAETTLDTSKEEKVDETKLTKSQKKRLKKKQKQQEQKNNAKKEPKVNGVEKAKKEKPEPQQKADKKKAKEEAKKEVQPAEKKEKKSLSGGVQIEDMKVGSGPVAKPGKTVMVYYEGRLKQNNKMFDNCSKGPGFAFRLGAKEVISGWDIGVAGMKVGGKRTIICPPAMAYGAKGSPPVIPPNSTLVFQVELKNVK